MTAANVAVRGLTKAFPLYRRNVRQGIATDGAAALTHLIRRSLFGASDPVPDRGSGKFLFALDEVSFEVAPGEVLGVIGRNGAGKSTLLKILARVLVPTAGEAKIRGRVVSMLEHRHRFRAGPHRAREHQDLWPARRHPGHRHRRCGRADSSTLRASRDFATRASKRVRAEATCSWPSPP